MGLQWVAAAAVAAGVLDLVEFVLSPGVSAQDGNKTQPDRAVSDLSSRSYP